MAAAAGPGAPGSGATALAMPLLVPFSNPISGGGFAHDGRFHVVAPNLEAEPLPIHGDGFQRQWEVVEATGTGAVLALEAGGIGPWRYSARVTYALTGAALDCRLETTNRGEASLPFGGGFHPWFPRRPGTRLGLDATGVWLEDARHLPTEYHTIGAHPEWNFAAGAPLPTGWINNAFTGWDGRAWLAQPEDGLCLAITAHPPLGTAIVFSPGADAGFLAFEPVSHPVDAHNLAGQPGLRLLAGGESLTLGMRIGW